MAWDAVQATDAVQDPDGGLGPATDAVQGLATDAGRGLVPGEDLGLATDAGLGRESGEDLGRESDGGQGRGEEWAWAWDAANCRGDTTVGVR